MCDAATLIEATRDGLTDRRHRGHVAVVDVRGNILASAGDLHHRTYMRSSAKPLQAMAIIESGAAEVFDLSDREIAVACASHSAQPEHVDAVHSILHKIGVGEEELRCGCHPPVHEASRVELYRRGDDPSSVHSNCSGKHAGMLAVCAHRGWQADDYRSPSHPLQQMLHAHIGAMSGLDESEISVGVDGCGLPVHGMTVVRMAYMFARLGCPYDLSDGKSAAAGRVVRAMQAHPLMVAGEGRICTALNGLPGSRFAAKGGALGVYCVCAVEEGFAVTVKVEDGNGEAAGSAALEVLSQMGMLTAQDEKELEEFWHPPVRNVLRDVVGQVRPTFALRSGRV